MIKIVLNMFVHIPQDILDGNNAIPFPSLCLIFQVGYENISLKKDSVKIQ